MGLASTAINAAGLLARQVSSTLLRATDGRDVLLNSPDGWEVEQPWLWWTGNGGPIGHPIPGATPWAQWAGIPAVSRATSLIVDTLAALPWRVLRGTETLPTPDWIADPQALRLDGRIVDASQVADARWSWMDFWAQWIVSALWFGDGYVYVPARDAFGAPRPPLYVLHPEDVRIEDGSYIVADTQLSPQSLIHLRGQGPIVAGHGCGVFERFARELGYTWTIRDYAASVFYNGVPAGYLKVTKDGLAQDKADQLKARWLAAHGGSQKSIAVLNSTTEFHPLTFTPVDTALIEAMAENLNELANAFGIPGYLLGASTDNNTYANIESRRTDLVTFTYLPWAARMEAVLDAQLPRGTSVKIALDAMARADTKTRYDGYKVALDAGFLTVDEVRELEDRPPLAEEAAVL